MTVNNPTGVRALALSILNKKRDKPWDKAGTSPQNLSQGQKPAGTSKIEADQGVNPFVPVSHALGTGTVGQTQKAGTRLGTRLGQGFPFTAALDALERRCPDYVEPDRWQQCIEDGQRFLATWGDKAFALGWTASELFGLHKAPQKPHPSYNRLSRYDCTGLIWNLQGRRVVALTESTAALQGHTGNIVTYRKAHKPAYGPLGDSLEDFTA